MKCISTTDNLRRAVSLVEKNTGKKTTLPVLSSILICAEKGKISLTATNLETGLEVYITGKIEEEGSFVIPARVLSSYLSVVSDDTITLETKKESIIIQTKQHKTLIKGYSSDDFPILPKIKKDIVITIPSVLLRESLQKVLFSASVSDIKPELSSILCSFTDTHSIKIVATDSFRLAEITTPTTISKPEIPYILIPIRSAIELSRILESIDDVVDIAITKGQISVSHKTFTFISRLTDGVFPDYTRIIPKSFITSIQIDKQVLLDTLRAVSLFSGRLSDVVIDIDTKNNTARFTASNADIGEHVSTVSGDIEGESITTTFNYKYLLDGIHQVHTEKVYIGFSSATGPLLMRSNKEDNFIYLVMPMRV